MLMKALGLVCSQKKRREEKRGSGSELSNLIARNDRTSLLAVATVLKKCSRAQMLMFQQLTNLVPE